MDSGYNFVETPVLRKFFKDRIIFLAMPIDVDVARWMVFAIGELDRESGKDITIYINSPGGLVHEALKVLMHMKVIKADICTVNIGQASGMAAFILMMGTKGKRFCLKGTTVKLTRFQQFYEDIPAVDIDGIEDLVVSRTKLNKVRYNKYSNSEETIDDAWQVQLGIVDKVISKR